MGRCVLDTSVVIALEKGHLTWESITSDYEDASVPAIAAHAVVEDAILVTRDKNARLSELTGVVTREV